MNFDAQLNQQTTLLRETSDVKLKPGLLSDIIRELNLVEIALVELGVHEIGSEYHWVDQSQGLTEIGNPNRYLRNAKVTYLLTVLRDRIFGSYIDDIHESLIHYILDILLSVSLNVELIDENDAVVLSDVISKINDELDRRKSNQGIEGGALFSTLKLQGEA